MRTAAATAAPSPRLTAGTYTARRYTFTVIYVLMKPIPFPPKI